MRIDIITVLPELIEASLSGSIVGRARRRGLVEIQLHWLREFSDDIRKSVDDYSFGPDPGMVLKCEPIFRAVEHLQSQRAYDEVIYMAPDGERLTQPLVNHLSMKENLLFLCGHYKGVDQRVRDHLITREISIGDYVLSGGELPAAVVVDSIVRLLPGAISDEGSALSDSFQDGLLAPPVYTRPANFRGWEVPEVLRSGHDAKIVQWQMEQALARTRALRPELLEGHEAVGNATDGAR